MKKFLILLSAALILTSLAGCGIRNKIREKAANEIAEKMIEANGGGDVEIDDDKVVVEGSDGEKLVVGSTEWPTSELAQSIPEFTDGKITTVMETDDSVMVALESVDEEDAKEYIEVIKEDFAEESYEANSDGYRSYGAKNTDGIAVTVSFSEGTLTVIVAKEAQ